MYRRILLAGGGSSHARQSAHCRAANCRGRPTVNMSRTERPTMPARNIKSYIAVVAAAAAVGFGAATPAAASAGFAAAPPSALATGSGGNTGLVSKQDVNFTQVTPAMSDDPHTFDDGPPSAVLCATAIEYGLIAAL